MNLAKKYNKINVSFLKLKIYLFNIRILRCWRFMQSNYIKWQFIIILMFEINLQIN